MLARLIGIGLVWLAVAGVRSVFRGSANAQDGISKLQALLGPALAVGVGVVLLVNPDRSTVFVGRLIGGLVLMYVAWSITDQGPCGKRVPFLGVVAALGVLLIVLAGELLSLVVAVSALFLVAVCLWVLVVSLDARTDGAAKYRATSDLVLAWLRDRPKALEARQNLG